MTEVLRLMLRLLSVGPNDDDEDAVQEYSVVSCVRVPKAGWSIKVSSTWIGTVHTATIINNKNFLQAEQAATQTSLWSQRLTPSAQGETSNSSVALHDTVGYRSQTSFWRIQSGPPAARSSTSRAETAMRRVDAIVLQNHCTHDDPQHSSESGSIGNNKRDRLQQGRGGTLRLVQGTY